MSTTFFDQVYDLVSQVPYGRVTTYGSIALALGEPFGARQVGWALAALSDDDVPAHRVIKAGGALSPGFAHGVPGVQRTMLEEEGVEFDARGRVPLQRFQWDVPAPGGATRQPLRAADSAARTGSRR